MIHATIARSATNTREYLLPVFTEFSERLGSPVLVTGCHRSDSMTPGRHIEEVNVAISQMPADMLSAVIRGEVQPYILHFYASPLKHEANQESVSKYYHCDLVDELILDQHTNDSFTDQDHVIAFMREYADLVSTNEGYRTYHEIGPFVHFVDDDYIHSSILGTLTPSMTMGEMRARFIPGAIVCQNVAFIPRDVIHGHNTKPILQALLAEIRPHGALTPEQAAQREEATKRAREAAMQRRIDEAIDRVRSWVTDLGQNSTRETQRQIERLESDARNYRQALADLNRQMQEKMATLEAQRSLSHKPNPNDLNSLRKIMRKGIITNLLARTNSNGDPLLQLFTRPLLMLDERSGAYHLLGSMKVEINMRRASVCAWNQDRTINAYSDGMQAPHIFAEGNPCYGNFADAVAGFVSTGDWYSAIELTLAFLESANTDDVAGAYVHKWPFVAEPERYGYPAYDRPTLPCTLRMPRDPEPDADGEDSDDYDGDYDGEREDDEA